jgi:hypothetical protein
MREEGLSELNATSIRDRGAWRMPEFSDIDCALPFVPDDFTQLYHTPAWDALNTGQRLRYNQLFGLRTNELFMVFEKGVTQQLIQALQQTQDDALLRDCLEGMLIEESRHHQMFLNFNRILLPRSYANSARCFSQDSALERGLLPALSRRPTLQPLLLWAVLVLEEFSTAFSRLLLDSTGLEPQYCRLHELHLRDEQRHVELDVLLMNRLMDQTGRLLQRFNGRLFRGFFRQVLSPRHSGPNVIRCLVREDESLVSRESKLLEQVRRLGQDPGLADIMTNPDAMPLTHELLVHYPSFRWF